MSRFSGVPSVIPPAISTDIDEVYTFLGAALFVAQGLELEVTNLIVGMHAHSATSLEPGAIPRMFDERESHTFGRLLKDVSRLTAVDAQTQSLLSLALVERNRLVHRFFSEHSDDLYSAAGRAEMIDDLRRVITVFREADAAANSISTRVWEALGLTPESIEQFFATQLALGRARDATA
jgi:hypothetical protein